MKKKIYEGDSKIKGMRTLTIYYSKTGNTKLVAETIAKEIKSELLAIKPKKEIKSTGFLLYFRGGFQSITKRKIEIEEPKIDINNFDLIFLGTPVWAWNLNPVVRSFLETIPIKNKKICLFCCCASSGKGVLKDLEQILEGNEILGKREFIEPLKNDTEKAISDAKKWAKEMKRKARK
ncbi:MAG: flavodoxin family protein [Candidatus Heimdallarchaeota archaeon]